MLRSGVAVILGYAIMALGVIGLFAIWFQEPNTLPSRGFMLFSLVYGGIMAVMGGYVTAAIANQAELKHALALAAVVGIMALVSMAAAQGQEPLWHQLANLLIAIPAVILGGFLKGWRKEKKGKTLDGK
ncbi:MAG: hypothetical protein MJA27_07595 [Pseudanabaenales cyanobacterium]|nr:hypothetical protein [Pseudanabaenales cyanobacterium]